MEINITEYLSDVEITDIVETEVRDYLKDNAEELVKHYIQTSVLERVWRLFDYDAEFHFSLRQRVKEVIKDLSTYELFRQPVDYGHGRKGEPGIARDLLAEVVHGQREGIESRVSEVIGMVDDYDIGGFIVDAVRSMILDSAERKE